MKKLIISENQRFNMLTVKEEVRRPNNHRAFICKCDCGKTREVLLMHLTRSLIISCGCYRRYIHTKHNMHNSREYSTWENMIQRCKNPKAKKYYLYGGRGITVCDRWSKSFQNFYEDMGPRPEKTSLDRIDPNKGYYKDNCRWATDREQLANLRLFNNKVGLEGEIKTVEQWILDLKINRETFKSRILRGLSFKEALFSDVDIITLDLSNKQQSISRLSKFLTENNFDKQEVLNFLDTDSEEPINGYIVRYLKSFEKWPNKYN